MDKLTSLSVGLLANEGELAFGIGGMILGLMNMQPNAIASSGAGPSRGDPSPMNTYLIET